MKKILFIALSSMILLSCDKHIDSSSVPQAVQTTFKTKYPEATEVEWELERGEYEAKFKLGSEKKEAEFKEDGTFVKEEK